MTTLISREKLSKKISLNSWKCWGFVKLKFWTKFDFSNSVYMERLRVCWKKSFKEGGSAVNVEFKIMRKLPEIVPWWRSSVQKKRPCIWIGEEHHHHCRLFRGDLSEVIQQVQQQSKQLSSTPTGNYAVSPIMIPFFLDFSSTFWNRNRLDWLRECRLVWNAYTLFESYSKCRIWIF